MHNPLYHLSKLLGPEEPRVKSLLHLGQIDSVAVLVIILTNYRFLVLVERVANVTTGQTPVLVAMVHEAREHFYTTL